jgi:hypothetical protein
MDRREQEALTDLLHELEDEGVIKMALSKAETKQWIEQNAEWYSEHNSFPLCALADGAVWQHCTDRDKRDYVEFVHEQFYTHARRVFTKRGLDMRKDK